MKIKLNRKHKIALIVISILMISSITIGISYSYWQITKKQSDSNLINTGCFEVTFEETGSDITLTNTFPISDQEGLALSPYKFKIKNICTIDSEYYVTLNSFGESSTLMDENAIAYAFDLSTKTNLTPKILGSAPENTDTSNIDLDNLIKSYYLKGGYLRVGEEKEFSLYLWMDQDASISEMNKTFHSKIYITNIATDEAPLLANLTTTSNISATGKFLNGPLVKNTIEKLEFVSSNGVPDDAIGSWDVSAQQNGGIMAWYYDSDSNGLYEVYIGQEEEVIANSNSSYLFQNLTSLKNINLSNLDTSNITNMANMFSNASSLINLDVSSFNTLKVTNMHGMFSGCSSLTNLDVSIFNTSNVTIMSGMFSNCSSLTNLNLNNFDTSKVTIMKWMFDGCSSLTSLNLNNFDTSNVIDMSYMFNNIGHNSNVFTLDLGDKFDTSKVTNMSYMFSNASSLINLDISSFNTSEVMDMTGIFTGCRSLTDLDVSSFNTSKVTSMYDMFSYTGFDSTVFTLDLGDKFDTSNVTNMEGMFSYTGFDSTVLTLDLGDKFDTSNVITMRGMFTAIGYSSLVFTLDLGDKFDTSKVTFMDGMFRQIGENNTGFTLNLGNKFDTSNVVDMNQMFYCTGRSGQTFTLDLGDKFDTSNVLNMSFMFADIGEFNPIFTLDFGNKFDTSKVTDMYKMFAFVGSRNANFTFDLRTFNFDNVTNYGFMFDSSETTHTAYVKNASDATWISNKGFKGKIIDCSANTCP